MRIHFALIASLCLGIVAGCQSPEASQASVPEANRTAPKITPKRATALPILFIVGDSTVHNTAPGLLGWGDVIGADFDPAKIRVENHAQPGRSTRTFITQGWWAQILAVARPGDFVIIQMGHNDSSPVNDPGRSRGTLPGIGDESTNLVNALTQCPETVLTYGGYLRRYLAEARAKGMTPILCTSVPRLPVPGREQDTTRYAAWAREVAAAENVPLIDLNQCALDRWTGQSTSQLRTNYFAAPDTTHFNRIGAELNASCVADGIRALTNCPLKEYLMNKP